ncbi:MAG: winged helix-turn-helix domain-containing protein [Nitrososphaerota archaeon]
MGRKYREEIERRIISSLEESSKTLRELQEELRIPRRTLLRYIKRLRDRGVVMSLGRGRGYILGDPEAIANYFIKLLDGDKFYESIPFYDVFSDLAINAPTKRARRILSDMITDLIPLVSLVNFLYTATTILADGGEDVEYKAVNSMNKSNEMLLKTYLKILRRLRSSKPRAKLMNQKRMIGETALKLLKKIDETVNRVKSHVKVR